MQLRTVLHRALFMGLLAMPLAAAERPNILLIVADDLGYGELGCQGNPQVPTPNIDSLAAHGVRFTSGYVTAPFCAPSRAGFMSGRHQARFGYDINPTGKRNLDPRLGLPASETTLAARLKQAGYATGLVGKWHLGGGPQLHPRQRGFDEFFGFLHEGHYYAATTAPGVTSFLRSNSLPARLGPRWTNGTVTWNARAPMNEPLYDQDNPILRGTVPVAEKEFLTDCWAREAGDFIQRHRQSPFFLYLAYNAPHSPMQALGPWLDRFQQIEDLHRRMFAAMVAHLDDSIGRVLSLLRAAGLEEKTLIIFLSDNGGPTAELTSSNAPLSGGKGNLLEGGIRVPFIVQWKGRLPEGKTFDNPISSLDIVPTALAAAQAPFSPGDLDGVNLLPFLRGEKAGPPHATLFWRYGPACAVRRGDWKLLKRDAKSPFRLFNLARDLSEKQDLASAEPVLFEQLKAAYDQWNSQMAKPISP